MEAWAPFKRPREVGKGYTPAAWAALVKKPEDRGALVNALLKILGGRLVSVHYSFGGWSGLVIFEAPDGNKAMAAIANIISPGNLKATNTFGDPLPFRRIEPVTPDLTA